MRIVTHNGVFHADEVFAVAVVQYLNKDAYVVRSRDPEEIELADIVIDVGGVYDAERGFFDHHQRGGVIMSGRSYSAVGLVWKHYGSDTINKYVVDNNMDTHPALVFDAVRLVDERLIMALDFVDVGGNVEDAKRRTAAGLEKIPLYGVSNAISACNPHPLAEGEMAKLQEEGFKEALSLATGILLREVKNALLDVISRSIVESLTERSNNVMVMEKFVPWTYHLTKEKHNKIRRVMWYDELSDKWMVQKTNWGEDFPEEWWGRRGEELNLITGRDDAVFCHPNGFICGFVSKESAIWAAYQSD